MEKLFRYILVENNFLCINIFFGDFIFNICIRFLFMLIGNVFRCFEGIC